MAVPDAVTLIHFQRLWANKSIWPTKPSTSGKSVSSAPQLTSFLLRINLIYSATLVVSSNSLSPTRLEYFIKENSSAESRPICECDLKLIQVLALSTATHSNYDATSCVKAENASTASKCCNWKSVMYASYNPDKFCCSTSDGIRPIGQC